MIIHNVKILLFMTTITGILVIADAIVTTLAPTPTISLSDQQINRKTSTTTTSTIISTSSIQCIQHEKDDEDKYDENVSTMFALTDRASSLNLKKSFNARMPCSVRRGTNASIEFIREAWGVHNGYFYGKNDVSFVEDPFDKKSEDKVLRVFYGKGSFSPAATRAQEGDVSGGTEFYVRPFNDSSYKRGLISYDVAFDGGFDWVKGGKLPGLYGGEPTSGCTGGRQADGSTCFSVRMMWRSDGHGEAYAYLPFADDPICKNTQVKCNEEFGTSLARGAIDFTIKNWTRIEIYTKMNDPGQNNGELHVWQDNRTVIDIQGMVFRNQNTFAVSSLLFSTFFGGSSEKYATPSDTYTYFRNIQFSVADVAKLDPLPSSATMTFNPSFQSLWLIALMTTSTMVISLLLNCMGLSSIINF